MKQKFCVCFLLIFAFPLWSDDSVSLVGLKLTEVIEKFGAPQLVFSARGNELWQDDVIFRYAQAGVLQGDLYIYRDRVWQAKVSSSSGINVGDPKQSAVLVMAGKGEDRGDHLVMPLTGRDWPMMLRVNLNSAGRVVEIYIFRTDF